MRINGITNAGNVYNTKKVNKAYSSSSVPTSKDTLAISDFAKELQIAKQAVLNTPDVRQDKVDEIKKQMEAGNYNVSASQLADKLLKKYFE